MASSNNNEIISVVSPHTIKKFELIEAYVQAWAHKLLEFGRNTGKCKGIVLTRHRATNIKPFRKARITRGFSVLQEW